MNRQEAAYYQAQNDTNLLGKNNTFYNQEQKLTQQMYNVTVSIGCDIWAQVNTNSTKLP